MSAARFPLAVAAAVAACALHPGLGRAGPVRGRVTYVGPLRAARATAVARDQRACGASQPDASMLLSPDGGLQNAVVSLVGAPPAAAPAAAPPPTVELNQLRCRYEPRVLTARVGSRLVAINSDPILHTVHGWRGAAATAFNIAMPFRGQRTPVALTQPGIIHTGCDAGHAWMTAWVLVFDHPFHGVTARSGAFELPAVPPGAYALETWHERLGTRRTPIVVPEAGPAEVVIQLR